MGVGLCVSFLGRGLVCLGYVCFVWVLLFVGVFCVCCVCLEMFRSMQMPRSMLRSVFRSVQRCSDQCTDGYIYTSGGVGEGGCVCV